MPPALENGRGRAGAGEGGRGRGRGEAGAAGVAGSTAVWSTPKSHDGTHVVRGKYDNGLELSDRTPA